MNKPISAPLKAAAFLAAIAASFATGATASGDRAQATPRPLTTAIYDPELMSSPNRDLALSRIRELGAGAVRLILYWRAVAPGAESPTRPANFDATDPADPRYAWGSFDAVVRQVVAHGLAPIVGVQFAPRWAEGNASGRAGTRRPSARELALFATAAARRYSGRFEGLPRVRYWQVWNEPNLGVFLNPQVENGTLVSPSLYRDMVNQFSAAVHAVSDDNVVIAGGTAPFGRRGSANGTPPLQFMRSLLCLSGRTTIRHVCPSRTSFDVWAHNPYTLGEPTRQALDPDNVSLGDLPEMQRVLVTAARRGAIASHASVPFWVTEFSWDSNPPDPQGVPEDLHARWVAEALYRMWTAGVSLVTWFQLRDDPRGLTPFQSGLYLNDGRAYLLNRPKEAAAAFRFPFVAFRRAGGALVWGRTPSGGASRVVVERLEGTTWTPVTTLAANSAGIFTAQVDVGSSTLLRAVLPDGETSRPFSLIVPASLSLVNPFGS
jgi:hypothetical protein